MSKPENQEEEYFLRVEMTSGRYGRSRSYQTTTFEQNFSSHAEQIEAMQKLFPGIGAVAGATMVEVGNAGLERIKGQR